MAAGADVQRLMNSAMVRLPGATTDLMQLELYNVMNDFFCGSNVWKEDIDVQIPANNPAGTNYALVPDSPSTINQLMWVFQAPTSTSQLRGPAVGAAMEIPGWLTLASQPNTTVVYRATVALTVQDPTTRDGYVVFPSWVLAKYNDIILDGLLHKMMTQPNKPWSNTQLAVLHGRKFASGISRARVDATRNNTYRQQAWRFPNFTGGSQKGRSGWAQPQ